MEAIVHHSSIDLTTPDARALARRVHPLWTKLLFLTAFGLLIIEANEIPITTVRTIVSAVLIVGALVLFMAKLRSAQVAALLEGADSTSLRLAVTDTTLHLTNGPISLARDWDSIASWSEHRGFLILVARSGARIGIPAAAAPPGLVDAILAQLRRRGVAEPKEPAFRTAYVVLAALAGLLALFSILHEDPLDLCDQNPGLTYWDADGPHTC